MRRERFMTIVACASCTAGFGDEMHPAPASRTAAACIACKREWKAARRMHQGLEQQTAGSDWRPLGEGVQLGTGTYLLHQPGPQGGLAAAVGQELQAGLLARGAAL